MGLQQTTRDWKESISHKVAKSGQFVYDISEIMGSKDRRETRWLGKMWMWARWHSHHSSNYVI